MALILPFKAIRPQREYAAQVAALPYDVMTREEAQKAVAGNALSFLHVEKSEIDVPDGTRSDDELIYRTAKSNFARMREKGILLQEKSPCFYIYRQQMGARVQIGIVGLMSAREYDAGKIKKHELTRQDKEEDRTSHVDAVNAQTGPVFITYRYRAKLDEIVNQALTGNPEYNFTADDGVIHKVWVVDNPKQIQDIKNEFLSIDALYIADGHHRAAAAANVARKRRNKYSAAGSINESDMVLAVLFPHDQLKVMDYNRAVRDLNGLTPGKYLEKITSRFTVNKNFAAKLPQQLHDFGMYLAGEWYQLIAKKGIYNKSDPVASLDSSILQEQLLAPVLGIKDPRTDDRLKFIGGIRGMAELEKLVDKDGFAVAFSLYPPTVEQIMKVSDAGAIMPPKSTWFEPKLRSGIFIHDLS